MFKKLLAIVTAASIAVGTCAFSAFAEATPAAATSGNCGEKATWSFDESTGVLTIAGTGDMYTKYTPVDKWGYYPYRNEIKEVVVEKGVTSIAQCAFGPLDSRGVESTRYPNLAKITLSETIKSIEDYAFYKTGLECIELPEGLETIGVSAFSGTSLSGDLVLPKTLNSIGQSAFSDTGITSVNLNEGMTLGGHAFSNCNSLKVVTIAKNIFYSGTGAFNAVRQNAAFSNCKALEKVVILGGGIVYIDLASEYPQNGLAQDMFMGCTSLKEVVIKSDNISYVDPTRVDGTYVCGTFDVTNNPTFYIYKDSITEKTLKDAGYLTNENFVYIADKSALEEALKEAENVNTSLYTDEMVNALKKAIEAGKAVIADEAASQADVDNAVKAIKEALTIPTSGNCGEKATWSFDESTGVLTISGTGDMYTSYTPVDKWEYYPYRNEIKEVVVEKGVTSIAQCAFGPFDPYGVESTRYPNLAKITLSETIKSIGDYAFFKTGLEHIEFSEGLETIGERAFCSSSLSGDLTLPKTLKTIGQAAFSNTNITSVNLNEGMTLGGTAFRGCNNLKEVTIPKNLTYLVNGEGNMGRSNQAFVGCKGLEKVTILGGGTVRIHLGTNRENGIPGEMFIGCTSLKEVIIKTDNLEYVEKATFNASGNQESGTFDVDNNITFYIYKDSTTEKTLKDAGYLTDENFVYIANTSALEEAVKSVEDMDTSLYTSESVDTLNKAIEAGKAVIADEDAKQEDVDNAVKAIEDAIEGLELMPKGSISGIITAPGVDAGVKVTVTNAGGEVIAEVTAADGKYTISDLESGEYVITATAENCVSRSYEVTVADGDVTLDAEIHIIGDINGDGKITTTDVGLSNAHAKGIKAFEGYDTEVADISKDGKVTTADVGAINSHAQGVRALW